MKIVDLTHTIREAMPVYPGTRPPSLTPLSALEQDGFRETLLTISSHTGTHMDAPAHLFADGLTLDRISPDRFCGTALVIDCTGLAGGTITMANLAPVRALADRAEFLLFHTGWDRFWGQDAFFSGFPAIDADVAQYLLDTGKKGAGTDAISIDRMEDGALPIHRLLLGARPFVILENLNRLSLAGPRPFFLCALPLRLERADGAPVRAIAILEESP